MTRLCEICSSPIPYHDQGPKRYATRRFCSRACNVQKFYLVSPDAFWAKVEKTDGCWIWRGTISTFGYGVMGWRGRNWGAHRLAWTLANGPIPGLRDGGRGQRLGGISCVLWRSAMLAAVQFTDH